jgi:hypothetical protein
VIGPIGSGKSTLAQRIHRQTQLPLFSMDEILFDKSGEVRSHQEILPEIQKIESSPQWIIDGYGPYETILRRLELADEIHFLQTPLVLCAGLITLRWFKSALGLRPWGQPVGLSFFKIESIRKSYRTLWQQHQVMNPQLRTWISKKKWSSKVKWHKSPFFIDLGS